MDRNKRWFSGLTDYGSIIESNNPEDLRDVDLNHITIHETLTAEECLERWPEEFAKFKNTLDESSS